MSRAEAFQTAVELSERGKQVDSARNYAKALSLYEVALDFYAAALKAEPNFDMKRSISERMKVYLVRAEQLKPIVQQLSANRTSSQYIQPPSNIITPSSSTNIPTFNQFQLSTAPSLSQLQPPPMMSNNSGLSPTGICAMCGGLLISSSLTALDRQWHPECFVGSIMCAGCLKPFSLANISFKLKDGRPYHPLCFEGTTGLSKQETKTFSFFGGNPINFQVEIPKKSFSPGERFQFHFKIDNPSSVKINQVVAYIYKTETQMEIVGPAFERRAKRSEQKLGRTEFPQNIFPLSKANFESDFVFLVPSVVYPSEVTGVDASFVREYEFVAKCVVTRPLKDIKVIYGITISDSSVGM